MGNKIGERDENGVGRRAWEIFWKVMATAREDKSGQKGGERLQFTVAYAVEVTLMATHRRGQLVI